MLNRTDGPPKVYSTAAKAQMNTYTHICIMPCQHREVPLRKQGGIKTRKAATGASIGLMREDLSVRAYFSTASKEMRA